MGQMHGFDDWGIEHPDKSEESYATALAEYKDQQTVAAEVRFSQAELDLLESLRRDVMFKQRDLEEEEVTQEILKKLLLKGSAHWRRIIHPAHVVTHDSVRPGLKALSYRSHCDFALDLPHYQRARVGNVHIHDLELEAVKEAVRRADELIQNREQSVLVPRSYKRGEIKELVKSVKKQVLLDQALRRKLRCSRIRSHSDSKLRTVVLQAVEAISGSAPRTLRTLRKKQRTETTSPKRGKRKKDSETQLDESFSSTSSSSSALSSESVESLHHKKPHSSSRRTGNATSSSSRRTGSVRFAEDSAYHDVVVDASCSSPFADTDSVVEYWHAANDDEDIGIGTITTREPPTTRTPLARVVASTNSASYTNDTLTVQTGTVLVLTDRERIPIDADIAELEGVLIEGSSSWRPRHPPAFEARVEDLAYLDLSIEAVPACLIIGYLEVKNPQERCKAHRDAIVIIPGEKPTVKLFRPPNKFHLATKLREADTREGVQIDGTKTLFLFSSEIIAMKKTMSNGIPGLGMMSKNEKNNLNKKTEGRAVQALASDKRMLATVVSRPMDGLINSDDQYYEEKMGMRPGGPKSTSGIRRSTDVILDASLETTAVDDALESNTVLRQKLATPVLQRNQRIAPKDLAAAVNAESVGNAGGPPLSPEQRAALCALLFSDPSWGITEAAPKPAELTYAGLDIDQVLGMGTIRPSTMREVLRKKGIDVSADSALESPEVKQSLQYFLDRAIDILVPADSKMSIENREQLFANIFLQQTVGFSRHDIFTKFAKWGTSVTFDTKPKAAHFIPSLRVGTSVLQVAIRFPNSRRNKEDVKNMIFDCCTRASRFMNSECKGEFMHGSPYPNADAVGEDSHFSVTIVGGAAFVFVALWLICALEDTDVEFSIETYNNKRYGSHIELALSDIKMGGELTLAAKCFARLKRRGWFSPVFIIPRAMDNMHDFLEPLTTVRFGKFSSVPLFVFAVHTRSLN
jgi:hypothetical protein